MHVIKKEDLIKACHTVLLNKLQTLHLAEKELIESIATEVKSSLGDKHETARPRMQAEMEKLSLQAMVINEQIACLQKINPSSHHSVVALGSYIVTGIGNFFISVPLGKIETDTETVFAISDQSPLAINLRGLKEGSNFNFNEKKSRIIKIS